jgi:TonB-dependent SusC/RagA subfamily outer membrane receptor
MRRSSFLEICGTTFLFQLFFITYVFSQDITVHGHVKNIFDRSVNGVSVRLKGTTIEVFTDSMGDYQITVPVKGKLVFSRKEYLTQKIAVQGKTTIDVFLNLDLNRSNDTEVDTGFGLIKKSETSQSPASVDQKLLHRNKEVDIAQLFETVPGVKVVYDGSEMKLLIRGIRSITSDNYALIVLNGSVFYGSLNDLDRNAIESIEVLKDADDIASYGSRGANGVVLISTKTQK